MAWGAETFLHGKLASNFVIVSGRPSGGVAVGITLGGCSVPQSTGATSM